jgi:non-specific serine/threonine protein kinase/serine/threonine-protein kinase
MTGFIALTPQYASPEQILGRPVGTASDVYSLAMVLYEMLTGRRPYEVDPAAITQIARVVCEAPPAEPRLDPDLDNILLMGLRKEAGRRYASVQEFADDVERALTHRPVRARPSSMSYLVSKFVRRNRVPVAAAVLVLGSLSGGLVSSLRAQRRERARFDQVRSLATTFLVDFDRDIRQLPGATAARERLVKTGLDTLDGLSRDAGGDPKLTAELVQAYISLGDVVGSPGGSSLGHADRAEVAFRKAFDLARPLVARDAAYRPQAALSCLRMGYLLWRTARSEEGRKWILDGIGYLQPAIDAGTATSRDYRLAANGMAYLSQMERQNRHGKQSAEYSVKSVELMRKYQTGAEDAFRARSDLARALSVAGNASAAAGDIARGAQLQRESLEIRKTNAAERPNDVENVREMGVAYRFLSDVEFAGGAPSLGNEAAADAARGEYYKLFRRLAEADRRNASAQHDYGLCLREMAGSAGDLKEAEAYAREGSG